MHVLRAGALELEVLELGATIRALRVPDRDGALDDVVLGFDSPQEYRENAPYFGCVVGRCANRIAHARFELDGAVHELVANDGPHHLHGGVRGFHAHAWRVVTRDDSTIRLARTSPDGEEGYPGALRAQVAYTLSEGELRIEMTAICEGRATLCNLAQHTYWNLAGHAAGVVDDHVLVLAASRYLPVDDALIPTGELADVADTPFDFRVPKPIGADLGAAGGYDHDFVVDGAGLRLVARVVEPRSGRVLELHSDQPGVQLYTGNFLDGVPGKHGAVYDARAGFCLETQKHPDAVHHPGWETPALRQGEAYRHTMILRFDAR